MSPRSQTAVGLLAALMLLGATACMIYAAEASAATPPPDAAPPLRYAARQAARAAAAWSDEALIADARGLYWQAARATCRKTAPRRYACDIAGAWHLDGYPTAMTYRLRSCAPSRRVWAHALYRSRGAWRARVLIDDRGGLVCRVPRPPFVP